MRLARRQLLGKTSLTQTSVTSVILVITKLAKGRMRMSRRETLDFSRAANLMQFEGYGVIERVELVSQWDSKRRLPFSNHVFDCAVLSMKEENEEFDWTWINKRWQPELSDAE